MNISQQAVGFIEELFHVYLEKRDFNTFMQMLDDNISWIGTGGHEVCHNFKEAQDLIDTERKLCNDKFNILKKWYNAVPISDEYCTVYGELNICKNSINSSTNIMHFQFSMICRVDCEKMKLVHAHFSISNKIKQDGEFVNRDDAKSYNILPHKEVEEHNQKLINKVTELEALVSKLQIRELEIQSIYDNAEVAIMKGYITDCATIEFINPRALELLGYTMEQYKEETDRKFSNFVLEEDIKKLDRNINILKKNVGVVKFKIRVRRRDGKIILLGGHGVSFISQEGKKVGIYTFQDVTQEEANKELLIKKIQELMVNEKRYEIGMKNSSDIIFDYIIESKQLIFPKGKMKKFGLPDIIENPVEKISLSQVVHPNSIDVFCDTYEKIVNGEKSVKAIFLLYDINGNESINEVLLTNVFDDYGKPVRAIGIMIDITEKVTLEREKRYREAMTSGKVLTYEANVTRDFITNMNVEWSEKLGIPNQNSFSQMVDFMCQNSIFTDDIKEFRNFCSKNVIEQDLNIGKSQVVIEYRSKEDNNDYVWLKNTMNIIKDDITNDTIIRCYVHNINERKEKEFKIMEEQRFYEAMITKAVTIYEVNVTRNKFICGHEKWYKQFGIKCSSNYSEMMAEVVKMVIHPEDAAEFNNCYLRKNVLNAYGNGKREIYCEYRRLGENQEYKWFSCSMHLFEDLETNEIKGFNYIQDIDEEKKKQLELIYKSEHDALTKFYNKFETQQKVDEYLKTTEAKGKKHAFFLLDIDYFKKINDTFGHAIGDAILSQTARKVEELFRDDDILGRIGGDEFVILMRDIPNDRVAFSKAKDICNAVRETYIKKSEVHDISVSIGIAICYEHGNTYEDLYKNSDIALYTAKKNGRSQFVFYDKSLIH